MTRQIDAALQCFDGPDDAEEVAVEAGRRLLAASDDEW